MRWGWPRNNLRTAYRDWQALENRIEAARQELARRYQDLRREAERARLDPHQGLLRTARDRLEEPVAAGTLQARNLLKTAFTVLGKAWFRRTPASLQMDINRYTDRSEKSRRRYRELSARLQFAQNLLELFPQDSEFSAAPYLRLALIAPEDAWVLFQLRQKRPATRQAIGDSLGHSGHLRLANCRRWLEVLRQSLPPHSYELCDQSLNDLEETIASLPGPEAADWRDYHRRLDTLAEIANRQALQSGNYDGLRRDPEG